MEYEQEMSYIDRKINNYYNLYSARMMMVLSENTNMEHELNRILLFLKNLDEGNREEAILRLSETHRLMSVGYIGRKSFERRKKRNPNLKKCRSCLCGIITGRETASDGRTSDRDARSIQYG